MAAHDLSTILNMVWERPAYPSILCLITKEVENSNTILGIDEVIKLDEPEAGTVSTCARFGDNGFSTLCIARSRGQSLLYSCRCFRNASRIYGSAHQ